MRIPFDRHHGRTRQDFSLSLRRLPETDRERVRLGVAVFYQFDQTTPAGPSSQYVRVGDSGLPVEFHFCANCASTVFWYPSFRPEWVGVAIGCFNDRTLRPTQAAYEQDRHDWVAIAIESR